MRLRCALALLATVGAVSLGTSRAAASVTIGPDRIDVATGSVRAIVERRPFHLRFEDHAGRPVLAQVAGGRLGPEPRLAADPVPLGAQIDPLGTAMAAPFSVTAGPDVQLQWQGLPAGNQLAGAQAGVEWGTADVLAAQRDGEGVRLEVATGDPGGRKIEVAVRPDPDAPEAIAVEARVSGDGPALLASSFVAPSGEAFHGFGGQRSGVDLRGLTINSWATQTNYAPGPTGPVPQAAPGAGANYQFPNGAAAALHFPQAQFVSSRGYGFLLDQPDLARFRLGSSAGDIWQVEASAATIRFVVTAGGPVASAAALTRITGRNPAPASLSEYLDHPRTPARPCGREPVEYLRGFQSDDDATATALNGPHQPRELFYEPLENGWAAKTADGRPYLFSSVFGLPAIVVDYTNPDAANWWRAFITRELDCGARGFTLDFGEQVLTDMHFADGSDGNAMHNRFPILYARTTREAIDEWKRRHPGQPVQLIVRAGYNGRPGSAAFVDGQFHGDFTATWDRGSGVKGLIPDMLNRSIGGQYGLRCDIGGWNDQYGPADKEMFVRWWQICAFWPFPIENNGAIYGLKTARSYDAEAQAIIASMRELHRRAAPYTLRLWQRAQRNGVPINRPLWMAFPDDPVAARQDQQWMLGPHVLVAPIVDESVTSRDVYFPTGCWQRPDTGERFAGPKEHRVNAALDQLPYFFRCGRTPFPAVDSGAAQLPRTCRSRRRFTIRLREPRGRERLVSARVYVNGKRTRVFRRRGRLRARVDLRGLPKGRFTVRVVARTNLGRTLVSKRRYRTCARRHTER